jgi:WD40 repeat protein
VSRYSFAEVPSGWKLHRLVRQRGKNRIKHVSWAPNGEIIAIGFCDGGVSLWDIESNEKLTEFLGHDAPVNQIVWSCDEKTVLTASRDKLICHWNSQTGQLIQKIDTQAEIIINAVYSQKDRDVINTALITGISPKDRVVIQSWSAKDGRLLNTYEDPEWKQVLLGGSSDRNIVAFSLPNGTVQIWDIPNIRKIVTLRRNHCQIYGVVSSRNQQFVALSLEDGSIEIWDVLSANLVDTLTDHDKPAYSVSFSADSKLLASKSEDGTVRLWRSDTWKEISIRREQSLRGEQVEVVFHPRLHRLITFDKKNTSICIWDLDYKALLQSVQPLDPHLDTLKKIDQRIKKMAEEPKRIIHTQSYFEKGIHTHTHNYAHEQNLPEAAAEIQQLLAQLQQTYPGDIENAVREEIKRNPNFRDRLRNAFKEGGLEALKVLFAPLGIPIEFVRGWIEAEAQPIEDDWA